MITFPTPTVVGQASLVLGSTYAIKTIGTTNWTSIGAITATTGTIFVYNGNSVTGSGGDAWGTFSVDGKTWIWTGSKWQLVPLGTASKLNVPSSGNAASTEVVLGSDTRLTGAMPVTATGSSTARTLANRFGDVVNVLDYGAFNNGTNESATTTAIQAAIDANPGKAIYFPSGTYKISSQIRIKRNNTSLFADAVGSALINCAFDSTDSAILIKSDLDPTYPDLYNINIINLAIQKTVANTVASVGVELDRVTGAKLLNSTIANFATALKTSGGRNNTYSNMRFGAWGMTLISGTSIISIKSSTFSGGLTGFTQMFDNCIIGADFNADYVVEILGNDYCSFSNCYIAGANIAIVRINGESSNVYDNWFDQCYFDGAKSYADNPSPLGVWIQENSPVANENVLQNFTDCSFGQLKNAIYIDEDSTIQVGFSDCRFTNIYESGISCSSNDVDLRITGCSFRKICSQLINKQIINIIDASSIVIASNVFQFESSPIPPTGTTIIQLGSLMSAASVSITGNSFVSSSANVTDYVNGGATISTLTITGNASNNSTNTIVGNIIGNKENPSRLALDWYQEGTFSPTITFGGGSTGITYAVRTCNWTRIGNRVNFDIYIQLSSKGTSTGSIEIGTLPFAVNANNATVFSVRASLMAATVGDTNLDSSKSTSTTVKVNKMVLGASTAMTDADFTNSSFISISGVYFV